MARVFEYDGITAINFVDLQEGEVFKILEFRNHPQISKWMYKSSVISLQAHLDFIENLKTTPSSAFWLFKQGETMLGVGSLTRISITHQNACVGMYKNPSLSKVGDKIMQALQKIAFEAFWLRTLMLEVIATNRYAINCYERNGFEYTGRLKDFVCMNKVFQDVLIYQKINPRIRARL